MIEVAVAVANAAAIAIVAAIVAAVVVNVSFADICLGVAISIMTVIVNASP